MLSDNAIPASSPRAVLWDMDGTLLDSAAYHWLAWQETMAIEGIAFTHADFTTTFGQRNDTILRHLCGPAAPPEMLRRISAEKEERYRQLVRARGVRLLPGVGRWLAHLQEAGWRQALASSAPRLNVAAVLSVLQVEDCFEAIVAGEDVRQGKPDPQVFLLAAQRLGVPPARCVVVEDSPAGAEAARRAGMVCIGVGPARRGLDVACRVASLADLPGDAFERLLAD